MIVGPVVTALASSSAGHRGRVVGVGDVDHVPAHRRQPGADVVAEREAGGALDGDVVAVVDPGQVAELQVPGDGGRLVGHALHHAAVAAQGVDVVVVQREPGLVVALRHEALRHRHADAVGHALRQRPGGRLHTRGQAVFRVPGRHAGELAELLDVVERDGVRPLVLVLEVRGDLRQVQQRIEQHRRVADRQHEAVAVGPVRVRRIVAQQLLPQRVADRRHAHRRAGMAGLRLLHGIHRQGADRVDGDLVDVALRAGGRGVGRYRLVHASSPSRADGPLRNSPRRLAGNGSRPSRR